MPSAKSTTPRIPGWVPDTARRRITELWALPWLDDAEREMLDRLATYDAMKTGVWEKLPSEPKDLEGNIIDWVWIAFSIFPRLPHPPPKSKSKATWQEWAAHMPRHPLPDPGHASGLARLLLEEMILQKVNTEPYWQCFWEGDKNLSLDQVIGVIDQVRSFYGKVADEYQRSFSSLPKVSRWSGSKPAQKFFTNVLSKYLIETYGEPLDPIVATLVEVAFDVAEGVVAETIRGRRRAPSTPENLKQKSR